MRELRRFYKENKSISISSKRFVLDKKMTRFNLKTDVCIMCCGLTIGKVVKNRHRSQSILPENIATHSQLEKAGITRSCVGELSICQDCQKNWAKPDFNKGFLTFPKVSF